MKKRYFLIAVLTISILFACESQTETDNIELNSTYNAKQNKLSEADVYLNCVKSFNYNYSLSYTENVLQFENHVNSFLGNGVSNYEKIDFDQLRAIQENPYFVLENTSYRSEFKTAILNILEDQAVDDINLFNEKEKHLIQTLKVIYNENNDDQLKKNIKTIAFAYGAQFNITKAILYAGVNTF